MESTFFPHGQLEAEPTTNLDVEVMVVGDHPLTTSCGIIRNIGDMNKVGDITSYIVEIYGDKDRHDITATNLQR